MSRCDVSADFARYSDVLGRIGEFRQCGKWVQFRCLFPERHKNGDAHYSGLAFVGYTGKLLAFCRGCGATWQELVPEVGLPVGAWFPDKGRFQSVRADSPRRRVVEKLTTYDYRDESGNLLYQKLRIELFDADHGHRIQKTFKQRRPLDPSLFAGLNIPPDAGQVWIWGMVSGEYGRANRDGQWDLRLLSDDHQSWRHFDTCRYVLYRLPELIAAHPDAPVFLVEGEKDVETLRLLGFTATCTNGTGSVPDPEWFVPLANRRVVIVADNDCTGKRHATLQAGILVCGGVRSLRVVWPGQYGFDVGDGGDITDWLRDDEHPRQSVIAMCKQVPEYRC